MEETVTLCTNCQREIAASNFVTHNVHCQRNLVKCGCCGEAVPRASLEEHHTEFHALVPCPNCKVKIERSLLDKHQSTSCKSRQQNCPYCELEFTVSDFYEHENYCGSRTKRCEECGEYVMLKYEQLHLDSNHGFLKLDDEPGPSAKWIKNDLDSGVSKSTSNNNLKKPQLSNGKYSNASFAENNVDDVGRMLAQLNKPKVWAQPRVGGVAYPLTGAPQRTLSSLPVRRNSFSDDDNEGDLVALPCEFCNAMIPSNQLLLHETGCQPEIVSYGFQTKSTNFQFNLAPKETQVSLSDSNSFVDVVGDSDNDSDIEVLSTHVEAKRPLAEENNLAVYDDTELPCEFCGAGYPSALLLEHQDVCDYHPKNWRDSSPKRGEHTQISTAREFHVLDGFIKRNDLNLDEPKSNVDAEAQVKGSLTSPSEHVETPLGTPFSSLKPVYGHSGRVPHVTDVQLTASKPHDEPSHHENQKKIPPRTEHDSSGLTSCQHFLRVHRVRNQTELVPQSRKREFAKKPDTQQSSFCNHVLHEVDFVHEPTAVVSINWETYSSQFSDQDKPRVQSYYPKTFPALLKLLPPNLSSSFRQYSRAGGAVESVSNHVSDFNSTPGASEWNDFNLTRPTSATGAIPKAKAGKLNIARQVPEEVSRSRSSNNKVTAAAYSQSQPLPQKRSDKSPLRNKNHDYDH